MAELGSTVSEPIATQNPPSEDSTSGLNGTIQNAKDSALNGAHSVMSSIQNNETVKSISTGPVAENVKDQAAKTTSEFQTLASSRAIPPKPAVTGQKLTHYHSFFFDLLSWKNPRATAISFASTVLFIFAARYLPILKWFFKSAYVVLGCTALMEIGGNFVFHGGLASKFRPHKYYTIPRESLEAGLEDVEQLITFFVIEAQRVVFAENVYVTVAVFAAALVSYWLIKLVPFWGLMFIGTIVIYLTPLIYIQNKEAIDSALNSTGQMINAQTNQLKDMTAQHTNQMTKAVKEKTSEYTSMAQEYINPRQASEKQVPIQAETSNPPAYSGNHFPSVPKSEPLETPNVVTDTAQPAS